MAKPIRATPTVTGDDAVEFVTSMRARENMPISAIGKRLLQVMDENRKLFRV